MQNCIYIKPTKLMLESVVNVGSLGKFPGTLGKLTQLRHLMDGVDNVNRL